MRIIYIVGIVVLYSACSISTKTAKEQGVENDMRKELNRLQSIEEDYLTLRAEYAKLKKKSYATEKGLRDLVYQYDSLNQVFTEFRQVRPKITSSQDVVISNAERGKLLERIQILQQKVWDLEMQLDKEYVAGSEDGESQVQKKESSGPTIDSPLLSEFRTDLSESISEYVNNPILLLSQKNSIMLRIPADYLFQENQRLSPEGGKFIFEFSKFMREFRDVQVDVIGHTDSQGSTKNNWDISLRRATTVVQSMINGGCNPLKITASGKGQYDELVRNDTDENRAINRRIEIVLSETP